MAFARRQSVLAVLLSVTNVALFIPVAAQKSWGAAVDAAFFTIYDFDLDYKTISFSLCDTNPGGVGCSNAQSLGPFGRVGSMVEGYPTTVGNVVTRNLYVVDVAAGSTGFEVHLSVYKKADTISEAGGTSTIKLTKTVTLPLLGGATAVSFMAADRDYVFVGTDQEGMAVKVHKNSLAITIVSVFGTGKVFSITADDYGYVSVKAVQTDWKHIASWQFNPSGELVDTGGSSVLLNSTTGYSTPTAPNVQ
jgi:hypothetical protein